jgi:hypothetical protein
LLDFLDHLLVVGLQQLEEVTDVGRVVGGHCPEKKKKKKTSGIDFFNEFSKESNFPQNFNESYQKKFRGKSVYPGKSYEKGPLEAIVRIQNLQLQRKRCKLDCFLKVEENIFVIKTH